MTDPNLSSRRKMNAWLWAGMGCITVYTLIRLRGLLAGDFLYNPETLSTAPIPYFRWILFSAWAALVMLVGAYWMTQPSDEKQRKSPLMRWGARWLWLMATLTALGQFFLIHHWKVPGG